MRAQDFWKAVTVDRANLLDDVLSVLRTADARFCVIGGTAVNAYVEPVVTLDLDLVIAATDRARVEAALAKGFILERHAHSLNVSRADSDLRVQVQLDPRYASFVDRAAPRVVLGVMLPVAAVGDLLQGKLWAVQDASRRPSKRQKDLADIARLLEYDPQLRDQVSTDILARLYAAGE
jgi:hypothetical protein